MNFREARLDDAIALGELWFDSWVSTNPVNLDVQRSGLVERAHEELKGRWEVTVAENDGKIIGFLALAPDEKRLDQLFVAPDAQGQGIGKHFLEITKQRFPEGFWLSVATDNLRARAFYEREGLIPDHQSDESGARMKYSFNP